MEKGPRITFHWKKEPLEKDYKAMKKVIKLLREDLEGLVDSITIEDES